MGSGFTPVTGMGITADLNMTIAGTMTGTAATMTETLIGITTGTTTATTRQRALGNSRETVCGCRG
jgi:hypothetical protein